MTISAGSLSSDIFVTLPVRIINFISIDPLSWNTSALDFAAVSACREGATTNPLNTTTNSISSHYSAQKASVPDPHCTPRNSLVSENNYADVHPLRTLRVTNPDHTAANGSLPQSDSDASVYSTDARDGHEAIYDRGLRALERKLGNMDLAPGDPEDSDAEVDFAIGTARLDQQEWARGTDFESNDSIATTSYLNEDDEGYASQVDITHTQRDNQLNRVEGIGSTSFALRVQEKLVASDKLPIGPRSQAVLEQAIIPGTTPRLSYQSAVPIASGVRNHEASSSIIGVPTVRSSAAVKGPRASRVLPKPPTLPIDPSSSSSSVPSSLSGSNPVQYNIPSDRSRFSEPPCRSHTAPARRSPPSISLEAV